MRCAEGTRATWFCLKRRARELMPLVSSGVLRAVGGWLCYPMSKSIEVTLDSEQANELRKLAVASSGLLDRVVARLDESEAKNRGYEKMQRDYIVRIGKYYQRQLQQCDEMLTKTGVPEWVMNSDSDGAPGNAVTERLKWYLARRKDVKPEEAEPELQAEMQRNIEAASLQESMRLGFVEAQGYDHNYD